MEAFIQQLSKDFPTVVFVAADKSSWSPRHRRISYAFTASPVDIWSTLHELGHALLDHKNYHSDLSLLRKEVDAWNKALELAKKYNLTIDGEHIQSCLDTYRDWLHKRSTCPECEAHGLQRSPSLYGCFNCQATWSVSGQRFCRPYRLKMDQEIK
jgi:hypothetical protein